MLIKYIRQPHEKGQRYQKENARILVSRSCAIDQLIKLLLRGEGGGGEWVKISVRLTKSKIIFKKSIISYNKLEKYFIMSDFISYYTRA